LVFGYEDILGGIPLMILGTQKDFSDNQDLLFEK